jgi:hypothetical protein
MPPFGQALLDLASAAVARLRGLEPSGGRLFEVRPGFCRLASQQLKKQRRCRTLDRAGFRRAAGAGLAADLDRPRAGQPQAARPQALPWRQAPATAGGSRPPAREAAGRFEARISSLAGTRLHAPKEAVTCEIDPPQGDLRRLGIQGLASGMLAKAVHDAGWGQFLTILLAKAAEAARVGVKVYAPGTSQECPCGATVAKTLADRWHFCLTCGLSVPRDHASALCIKLRGLRSQALSEPLGLLA